MRKSGERFATKRRDNRRKQNHPGARERAFFIGCATLSLVVTTNPEINLLLPESSTRPLWRRLASDFKDALFPEKLPPLQLTSRPVVVGMLPGDYVSLPWYRTIFTNLGNVINPEMLPPLELQSRPVDVGELVSDQLGHGWWTSLLRNLADRVSPERMPALDLSAAPAEAALYSGDMQIMRWSSLIALPKSAAARPAVILPARHASAVRVAPQFSITGNSVAEPAGIPGSHEHGKLKSKISRSRIREGLLIGVAVFEGLYLLASMFGIL